MERKEWAEFVKRFPNQKAREAADLAVDMLGDDISLSGAIEVWNDIYTKIAGNIALKKRR